MALHLGPRLLVVTVYFHFLLALIDSACKANKGSNQEEAELTRMMKAIFYLQILEIIGLCGISFIHNREHYCESMNDNDVNVGCLPWQQH